MDIRPNSTFFEPRATIIQILLSCSISFGVFCGFDSSCDSLSACCTAGEDLGLLTITALHKTSCGGLEAINLVLRSPSVMSIYSSNPCLEVCGVAWSRISIAHAIF